MKKNYCLIIILLMLASASAWSETAYSTARLQAMASLLSLPGIDTLPEGEYTHFSYKSHPLNVRINRWREVEHIGLSIFNPEIKKVQSLPIYDFLERYLLELNIAKGTDNAIRLGFDQVQFDTGNADVALTLDGSEEFRYSSNTFYNYHVEWLKKGKIILAISFSMDNQLLSGCNAVELEKKYLKKIRRYRRENDSLPDIDNTFPKDGKYYIKSGSSFMADAIRNDLYFHKKGSKWELISNSSQPFRSIANTMLSMYTPGDYDLAITLDMYGYKEEKDTVKLTDWLGMCAEEKCAPYFGMKSKADSLYTGTVFMVNETSGFLHMLSFKISTTTLQNGKGIIEGRLFVYVPLHNVTKKLFNSFDYKKVDNEKKNSNSLPSPSSRNGDNERPADGRAEKGNK